MIHMRFLRLLGQGSATGVILLAVMFFTGCGSLSNDPKYPEFQPPATNSAQAASTALGTNSALPTNTPAADQLFPGDRTEIINIGDSLTITFMDLPIKFDPIERQVASDGTITLIDNQTFKAEGKSRGELEREIRTNYVPRLYPRMTVTIKPFERFFFVSGEVRTPGAQRYLSPITVLKAIPAAGDFTDFAQRKKIRLTRLNGKKLIINWYDAQKDPKLDPPVYPGDTIHVPRRIF